MKHPTTTDHVPAHLAASETLADRIRSVLDEKGWSARELARRAELKSPTHIGNLLKGADPQVSTIEAVAKAAGKHAAWLAFGQGPQDGTVRDLRDVAVARMKSVGTPREVIDRVTSDSRWRSGTDDMIQAWVALFFEIAQHPAPTVSPEQIAAETRAYIRAENTNRKGRSPTPARERAGSTMPVRKRDGKPHRSESR